MNISTIKCFRYRSRDLAPAQKQHLNNEKHLGIKVAFDMAISIHTIIKTKIMYWAMIKRMYKIPKSEDPMFIMSLNKIRYQITGIYRTW